MEVYKMKDYFSKRLVLVSLVLFLTHLGILSAQNTSNSGSYVSITDSINDRVLDEKSYGEVAQMLTHPLLLELANKLAHLKNQHHEILAEKNQLVQLSIFQ